MLVRYRVAVPFPYPTLIRDRAAEEALTLSTQTKSTHSQVFHSCVILR